LHNNPLKDTLYEVTKNFFITMDDVLFLTGWNLGAWRSPFAVFLPEKQAQFLHRHKMYSVRQIEADLHFKKTHDSL
jgi:hypothetical protein